MNQMGWFSFRLLVFAIAGTSIAAASPTLDQYKAAVEAADKDLGCLSIPNEDLRDRCQRAADFVKQECQHYGCEGLENKRLAENIKGKEDSLSSLKKDKDEQDSKKSSASDSERQRIEEKIKQQDHQIDEETRSLEDMKQRLATDRSDAGKRADQGRRCLEARNDVQYLFNAARSSAQSEIDPEKKPYADRLIVYWDKGTDEHKTAFELTKKAIEHCEKCKSGDL